MERTCDEEIHKRIDHLLRERTCMQMNVQKERSASSEYVRKTTGFFTNSWTTKTALESYLKSMRRTFGRETG